MKMKIFEIGVGNPSVCRTANEFVNECYLFEANPKIYKELLQAYGNRPNFHIHNVAIGDYDGEIEFLCNGDSSFISSIKSPASYGSKEYLDSFEKIKIPCKKICNFENDESIDVMLLDMEGSEWFVLKHLKNKPKLIIIEMQNSNKTYKNPFYDEIINWMQENCYLLKGKNQIEEDWFFKRGY
jgi:FkbM family methyltransferase